MYKNDHDIIIYLFIIIIIYYSCLKLYQPLTKTPIYCVAGYFSSILLHSFICLYLYETMYRSCLLLSPLFSPEIELIGSCPPNL
mgnify:FL=1